MRFVMLHNKRQVKFLVAVFLISLLYVSHGAGQTVEQVHSTRQDWSGGIAGSSGSNYTFTIRFSHCRREPRPDTIWIGQTPVPIVIADSLLLQANTHRHPGGRGAVTFDINVVISGNKYPQIYPDRDTPPQAVLPHSPIPYTGVALLSYKYKGRHKYFVISKIIKTFPPVSYP